MNNLIKNLVKKNETYVLLIILLLGAMVHAVSGLFFINTNIVFLLRSMTVNGIFAVCAMLAFVSTGADVSFPMIGALAAYSVYILGNKYEGVPGIVLILFGLLIGALCGALNGFFIVKYKLRSLIVTLAVSSGCYGIIFGLLGGSRLETPAALKSVGKGIFLRVTSSKTGLSATLPIVFLWLVVIYFIAYLVLQHTMVGRGIYAIGGDEIAASRAGYNVNKIRFGIFVVNGMVASLGALAYALMSDNCSPIEYYGGEMIVIAAIVLGGIRMSGGHGSLLGCLLGTFLLTMVTNSLTAVGISVYYQQLFIGLIIVIGATISAIQTVRAKKTIVKEKGE